MSVAPSRSALSFSNDQCRAIRQILEELQQILGRANIEAFFGSDNYVLLGVYAGKESVSVQVASPDPADLSFAWRGKDGRTHIENPKNTLAWLVDWAKRAEASENSITEDS